MKAGPVRVAGPGDIRPLAELWARAFPGERTVDERVRHLETGGVFGGVDTAFIAERDGRTVGAFRAYSLTQYMHGTACRMMGLAAVAVDETARRRGVGRELCEHAVRIARERGDTLSVLYPFRPAFYHALGWGLAGTLHAHRFRPESLGQLDGAEHVRRVEQDDSAAIAACYSRVAEQSNGLIARTPRIWRSHLEGDATHAYVTSGGGSSRNSTSRSSRDGSGGRGDGSRGGSDAVRGYVIVRFGRATTPEEKPLHIRELVAEDDESYETLLAWIAAQRDAWRIVHYDATTDERFTHRLAEPRTPGFHPARYLWAPVARVLRGPMLRILDVPAALEERVRWGPAAPMRFSLHVADPLVPENEGPFGAEFDGGRVHVRRGDNGRPALRLSVAVLSQIFAGELTVNEALRLGLAECDGDASTVNTLFAADRCFRLLDEF